MKRALLLLTLLLCLFPRGWCDTSGSSQKHLDEQVNKRLQTMATPLHQEEPSSRASKQLNLSTSETQQLGTVTLNADSSVNVPFVFAPTKKDFANFKIVDNNHDERTWQFEAKKKALMYRYSTKQDADDYVILPAVKITETSHLYMFSIEASPSNATYGESFEMYVGRTPDPKDLKLIFSSGMIYGELQYASYKAYFHAEEPGLYFVAVRATSPRNGWRLYVRNLGVEETDKSVGVPACPENVVVKAAELGQTEAIVSFTMPQQTAAFSPLAADKPLTAVLTCGTAKITVTGLPGTEQSATIKTEQGYNEISVTVANADGEGLSVTKKLFTGKDIPSVPEVSTSVSKDNMTLQLSWQKNTVGLNGGYVDPAEVTYKVKKYKEEAGMGTWVDFVDVGNATSYNYTLPVGEALQIANLGITASSSMGENKEVVGVSGMIGTPYTLPIVEYLRNKQFNFKPVAPEEIDENSNATWGFMDPADVLKEAANESGRAMVGYITHYGKSRAKLSFPKFSMEGQTQVNIEIEAYFHDLMPKTQVYAYAFGIQETLLGTIDATMGKGWKKVSFALPSDFDGEKWVGWYLTANYPGESEDEYLLIDKYLIRPETPHDLAVTMLDGNLETSIGEKVHYKATVENFGTQQAQLSKARFSLFARGVEVSSFDVVSQDTPLDIAPNQVISFEYEFNATTDLLGDIQVKFEILQPDDVLTNNSLEIQATVLKGEKPVITDLSGKLDESGGGMNLSWSSVGKLVGVQGFEKCTPFYYGPKLAEFKNVDMDKKNTYTLTGFKIPHQGYAKAFQVLNYELANITMESYRPHGGEQCLLALCPDDEATKADDWLISPAVKGGTDMSFFLNILNEKYVPEIVEVLVSNKTDDIADFTLLETIQKSDMAWQQCSFTLPQDSKYFAIRYRSFDCFGIMIDDIDYIPASGEPIVTYRVYKNDNVISNDLEQCSYHVENVTVGDRFNVSVCVDGVEYAKSNTMLVLSTGVEEILQDTECEVLGLQGALCVNAPAGSQVDVWTASGISVASFQTSGKSQYIQVPSGSYIIKIGQTTKKAVVR